MRFALPVFLALMFSSSLRGGEQVSPLVSYGELNSGAFDGSSVRIVGRIINAQPDEFDASRLLCTLDCDGKMMLCYGQRQSLRDLKMGSVTRLTVDVVRQIPGVRKYGGRFLRICRIEPVENANYDDDPFTVAPLEIEPNASPHQLQSLGRRSVTGTTLASWRPNNILLRTRDGILVKANLISKDLPRHGEYVEVTGLVGTDLLHICLSRALWRSTPSFDMPQKDETPSDCAQLVGDGTATPCSRFLGNAVRFRGIVRILPSPGSGERLLYVECDKHLVPVDISALHEEVTDISIGCRVEITGVCVFEAECWRSNAVWPRLLGYRIVPRTADDIVVTARPPWWTTGRLLTVVGALLATLLALLLWNVTLKRLVARKSREIADGEISRAEAAVKVYERTRLAVELHDSVAQSLTGVSMEIRAAQKAGLNNPESLNRHLGMATLSLESCRSDLRDCLWDLRNLTLEDDSMEDAIRRTLAPRLGDAKLAVRFSVDRERFTDNTAHTILRILRELATNAVRHGKASSVKVAGSIENGKLLFSVRDNGCGFNPSTAPSMAEGHFGLQGIRDRIKILGGTMSVESSSGKGARVTIALNLPTETAKP